MQQLPTDENSGIAERLIESISDIETSIFVAKLGIIYEYEICCIEYFLYSRHHADYLFCELIFMADKFGYILCQSCYKRRMEGI